MPTEQKYFRKDRRDPEWEVCGEDNLRAGVPGERVAFWRRPMRYDAIMYRRPCDSSWLVFGYSPLAFDASSYLPRMNRHCRSMHGWMSYHDDIPEIWSFLQLIPETSHVRGWLH